MAFQAGSIISKLVLDKSQWAKSVKDVDKDQKGLTNLASSSSKAFSDMAKKLAVAGIAAAGVLSVIVKKAMDAGDQMDKMSKRTGFSAETLSELKHAADLSGTSIDVLEKGVKRMSGTILDASYGLETYTRTFDDLGISVDDLMKMNPEEQFMTIAESIAEIEDPTIRAALAQDVFGRAGTALLPMLSDGAEGLERMRKEAHELGIVWTQEGAAKAAMFKDSLTKLSGSVRGLTQNLAVELFPALTNIVDALTDFLRTNQQVAKDAASAILTFIKLTVEGIGGLILAFYTAKAAIFKFGEEIVRHLAKLTAGVVIVTGYTKKMGVLSGVHEQAKNALKDLVTVGMSYNETADEQIEKATTIADGIQRMIEGINDLDTSMTKNIKSQDEMNAEAARMGKNISDAYTKFRKLRGGSLDLASALKDVEVAEEELGGTTEETGTALASILDSLHIKIAGVNVKAAETFTGMGDMVDEMAARWYASYEESISPTFDLWGTKLEEFWGFVDPMLKSINSAWVDMTNSMTESLIEWAESSGEVLVNFKDLFVTFVEDVIAAIGKMVMQLVTEALRVWVLKQTEAMAHGIASVFAKIPFPFNIAAAAAIVASITALFSRIKKLKKGAIVEEPTLAMVGEAGTEAVVPLTRPREARAIMSAAGIGGAQQITIHPMPVQIMIDGRVIATAVAKFTPELTKGGHMKIHTKGLISY